MYNALTDESSSEFRGSWRWGRLTVLDDVVGIPTVQQ